MSQPNTQVADPRRTANRELLDGNLERQSGFLPAAFIPTSFDGVLEMAKLMADSRNAVPAHLRGNIGACLAVSLDAYHLGVSPFALARASYTVNSEATISYEGKAIAAMVNARAGLKERLNLSWDGVGEALTCTCTGTFRGETEARTLTVEIKTITVRNSPMWKQQPRVQLGYWAIRAWARLYCPEVILGFHTPEDDGVMIDVTPPPAPPRPTREGVRQRMAEDMPPPATQDASSVQMRDEGEARQQGQGDAEGAEQTASGNAEIVQFYDVDMNGQIIDELPYDVVPGWEKDWAKTYSDAIAACRYVKHKEALFAANQAVVTELIGMGFDLWRPV